ncbi:MAG: chemotaxis protein, partial [Sphingobacteriales bacterium]
MKKSLRFNLMALVAAGIAALCVLAAAAMIGKYQADKAVTRGFDAKDVVADILPPPMYLVELRLVLGMAIDGTLPVADAQKEQQRLTSEYNARVDYWTANPPYGLETQLLGAQHEAGKKFLASSESVLSAVARNDKEASVAALKAAHELYLTHRAGVDTTVAKANAFAADAIGSYGKTTSQMLWLTIFVFVGATVGLLTLGAGVRRSVLQTTGGEPIEVARIANAVAEGDLTIQVKVRPGDTTSVMASMDRMCSNLRDLVAKVSISSDNIATGSQQIASGNRDLSVRTEQQAASLQQTASSMEQFSGTVQTSAENARTATQVAASASQVALRGAEVVGQVV